MQPMAGGYGGETYSVGTASDRVVLRIYARDPQRSVVDASLLRLVAGVLPAPRVLESRPPTGQQPGILVMEHLPGRRADIVLATADHELRVAIGRSMGLLLARLSGIAMLRFGMFEHAHLALTDDKTSAAGLTGWAQHYRDAGRLASWRDQDWAALLALVDVADTVVGGGRQPDGGFDPVASRVVLVHSDLNPKNVLVDAITGQITGLVDWEYAHAGSPYTDLGNLTRFERHHDFVAAVLEAFTRAAPPLVPDPLLAARGADLWALIELAGRERSNAVCRLAEQLLLAQARTGDLHAWPWDAPRVDPPVAKPVL